MGSFVHATESFRRVLHNKINSFVKINTSDISVVNNIENKHKFRNKHTL